jgi:hypothetical protein
MKKASAPAVENLTQARPSWTFYSMKTMLTENQPDDFTGHLALRDEMMECVDDSCIFSVNMPRYPC